MDTMKVKWPKLPCTKLMLQVYCWNVHIKHDLTLGDHVTSYLHSHTQKGTSNCGSQLDHSCRTQWSICRAQPVVAPLLLYLVSWILHVVGSHTVCMSPAQQMLYSYDVAILLCHASSQMMICWRSLSGECHQAATVSIQHDLTIAQPNQLN